MGWIPALDAARGRGTMKRSLQGGAFALLVLIPVLAACGPLIGELREIAGATRSSLDT